MYKPLLILLALAAVLASPAAAQEPARVTVTAWAGDLPLPGVRVRVDGAEQMTDGAGEARFDVRPGRHRLVVGKAGFRTRTQAVEVRADTSLRVVLVPAEAGEGEEHDAGELEAVVVTATRSEQRIEDAPVRVEVLAREEVEEKMMMTPGDVSIMWNPVCTI